MAVDYAEKEREFLDNLAADTGRDLAGWMAAIAGTQLTDRNAIIDWLRQQGFLFARASWLERIHHNGGRPIYLDAALYGAAAAPVSEPKLRPAPIPASPSPPAPVCPPAATEKAVAAPPAPLAVRAGPALPPSLDAVLAEAKGYRPLAQLVLNAITAAAPLTTFEPHAGYVALLGPNGRLAGVLTVGAKELRLALDMGGRAVLPPFAKPKFAKSQPDVPASVTHMIILTDARQVTAELMATVAEALAGA